ncbi:MAG: capsule assembly Wzi family protein [Bacteroidales bacterium]|nr:capsule assembly Wzi family protein [Bacteroidales bacterium]
MKRFFLLPLLLTALGQTGAEAQVSRLVHDVNYNVELSGTVSDGDYDYAPFWLTANRYGLSSVENNSGYLRAGVARHAETDSLRKWRIGYGLDLVVPINYTSDFVIQQCYADFQYKAIRLSIGAKERAEELKNAALSSGGLTYSNNARPIPQVRLELPQFWTIPKTGGWLAIKGHVAYGVYTDNSWQNEFHAAGNNYSNNSLFHSKAGFLRIGNTEKFPLSFTGGLEMYAQFGGKAWNVLTRGDDPNFDGSYVEMGSGLSDFWNVFIPGGSDATDGNYVNSEGNTLGSWHFSLNWDGDGWALKAYAEHYFEDHSQMFLEYGWKDMLWGVEATLPKNPFVTTVLYEHLRTTDQTGGVYHDATDILPVQISGLDNYYNHNIYGAWQHWGQAIGNPLLVSPIYNQDGSISFNHNRILAHHFGISGQPLPALGYRVLFSHIKSLGTYTKALTDPAYGNYFMVEANYAPRNFHGFSFTGAFATNGGDLLGHSVGGMLTVRKTGIFR